MNLAILTLALLPLAAVHVGQMPASTSRPANGIEVRARAGALKVVVTDPIAHRPVPYATVKIMPMAPIRPFWGGLTDKNGVFDAGLLPPGPYVVEVRTFVDFASTKVEVLSESRNVVHLEVFSEIDR